MKTIVEFPDRGVVSEEAAEWLVRLDAETPPGRQDLEALGNWLHRSPVHREELERLARLWGRMNVLTELAVPLGKPGHAPVDEPAARARRARVHLPLVASLAAFVAVAAVIGVIATQIPSPDPGLAANGLHATAVGQQRTATLADGSEVILNTNSQIRVDYGDERRDVHLLQGEVLFTVARDRERPFRVYAGNGRIEALGTAFSVHLKGEEVDVTVTEGRVSLASMTPSRRQVPDAAAAGAPQPAGGYPSPGTADEIESLATLRAGQVATIRTAAADAAAGSVARLEISDPIGPDELAERLAWREGMLMFSGDTLEDVVREVSRYTTVSIEIPDPRIRAMRIGGRFPVGEIDAMFDTFEASFGLRVIQVSRNRVVLAAPAE